jgi:rhomboid protease GluP
LIAINVVIFVAMVLRGVSIMQPNSEQLLRWGANFGPLTLDRQWWRLLTAVFLHIGFVHLAVNMWCLWNLGSLAEDLYGSRAYLAVYILSGLAGSIASLARNPLVVSAGASGAIFGVAGALIATLYLARLTAAKHALRISLISLVVFAAYSIGYGFVKGGMDNGAHIGGLVAGLILGAVLSQDFRPAGAKPSHLRAILFPSFAVILVVGAIGVRHQQRSVVQMQNAESLLRRGDVAGAARELNNAVRSKPSNAAAWSMLAAVYLQQGQLAPAEAAFQHAIEAKPSDTLPRTQLGFVYLRTRRFEPARAMFQSIVDINPKDADAYVNLGVTLNQLDRKPEAVECFRKATTLNPKLVSAWYNFGLTSMDLKRYDDAISAFTQATRVNPNDPEAWIWLANAYQAMGMKAEADAAYMKGYQLRVRLRQRRR